MKKRVAAVAGLAVVTLVVLWLSERRNTWFDARVYYGAINYWFDDGGMVYDFLRLNSPYGFTYPPFAGLVMAPMAVVPFPVVLVVTTVATVGATVLLVRWLSPDKGWFGPAVGVGLALCFEPVRETITLGQVNMVLLVVVAADLLFGLSAGRRWAGVGVGLATAIKLTPGVFIVYLLVTRRWRAAFTAMGTAVAATLVAAAIFPDQSREFWTAALWDTDRVGDLSYVSNQSLRGFVARLPFEGSATYIWICLVLIALGWWVWRVRRADVVGGLALTGVLSCLISPVTWVHHCVWLLPALIRCLSGGGEGGAGGGGGGEGGGRGRGVKALAVSAYLVMTSRLLWLWENPPRPPVELVGSNLYVYFSAALLIWTPPVAAPCSRVGSGELRRP
ncbi:glycosyltransferase 87 family protein [Actinoplanes sp. NPDC051470]|uniref:glycosyltransferase 87 family protein n=1 Tax=Actinoplanes sp. NPDC051470 TaxID=3157224 RepID=UPI00342EF822